MFDYDKIKWKYVTRADLFLIAGVLLASCLMAAAFLFSGHRGNAPAYAVIEQNGQEIMRIGLEEDTAIRIPSENGYNLVTVSDGGVSVQEADCPDQICVRQGTISGGGESILCLPHRLLIRLEASDGTNIDAMTN